MKLLHLNILGPSSNFSGVGFPKKPTGRPPSEEEGSFLLFRGSKKIWGSGGGCTFKKLKMYYQKQLKPISLDTLLKLHTPVPPSPSFTRMFLQKVEKGIYNYKKKEMTVCASYSSIHNTFSYLPSGFLRLFFNSFSIQHLLCESLPNQSLCL